MESQKLFTRDTVDVLVGRREGVVRLFSPEAPFRTLQIYHKYSWRAGRKHGVQGYLSPTGVSSLYYKGNGKALFVNAYRGCNVVGGLQ